MSEPYYSASTTPATVIRVTNTNVRKQILSLTLIFWAVILHNCLISANEHTMITYISIWNIVAVIGIFEFISKSDINGEERYLKQAGNI